MCLGLPSRSPIAAILAEAGAWPAQLRVERARLNYVERLHRVPNGAALLQRLRSRPHSNAGKLVAAFDALMGSAVPPPAAPPPNRTASISIHCNLPGVRGKRHTLPQAMRHEATETIHRDGQLNVFSDGSMLKGLPKTAAAACTAP